jgi:hypothetical protein
MEYGGWGCASHKMASHNMASRKMTSHISITSTVQFPITPRINIIFCMRDDHGKLQYIYNCLALRIARDLRK